VIGTSEVGGLVGNNGGTINQSYATGIVIGANSAGGLVGNNTASGSVASSFWDTQTSGQNQGVGTNAGSFSATGLTTAQFGNTANFTGWSFGTTPGNKSCGDGGCWVIVDSDGSFNNASGAAGATRPMLLSEWSRTITNAHQLELMNLDLGAHYKLANNIDVGAALASPSDVFAPNGAAGFVPIGQFGNPFTGSFDGRSNTIGGLVIAATGSGTIDVGLFGANSGNIRNVGLVNETVDFAINGGPQIVVAGGLAGLNTGTIRNSYVTGTLTGTGTLSTLGDGGVFFFSTGGLVGLNGGTIVNSYTNSTVSTPSVSAGLEGHNQVYFVVGGLVGSNGVGSSFAEPVAAALDVPHPSAIAGGRVLQSYASGTVTGGIGVGDVGGLIGTNDGFVAQSYASGTVIGPTGYVGGLIGGVFGGTVSDSYSIATVNAGTISYGDTFNPNKVGGLIGWNSGGTVRQSYAAGAVIGGTDDVGGLIGSNDGYVLQSFATSSVTSGVANNVGGLIGINTGHVWETYASGAVNGTGSIAVGGLIGVNAKGGHVSSSYWDTTTTGQGLGYGYNSAHFHAHGLNTAQFADTSNFHGWHFSTRPGGSGWVIVDNDGSLNNAGDAAGATRPLLVGSYSTTITSGIQLQLMALDLDANYKLGGNINLAPAMANPASVWGPNGSAGFVSIGQPGAPFTGTFNGQGYTINGLKIAPVRSFGGAAVGLFGFNSGTISNVALTNETVSFSVVGTVDVYAGGLAGFNLGTINNSSASGNISGVVSVTGTSVLLEIGGLVGVNGGTINQSFASGTVTSPTVNASSVGINEVSVIVGGLVGTNFAGTVSSTEAGIFNVPSLAGQILPGTINQSYAAGSNVSAIVTSSNGSAVGENTNGFLAAGGLVGANFGTINGAINYPTGGSVNARVTITGGVADANLFDLQAGGLVGNNGGTITQSNTNFAVTATKTGFAVNSDDNGLPTHPFDFAAGGLVGQNTGTIYQSNYRNSTGTGVTGNGAGASVGGLVGLNGFGDSGNASIAQSSSTGPVVNNGLVSAVGGLVGYNGFGSTITQSYATGLVTNSGAGAIVGGFVGGNTGTITSSYWDTSTTGQGQQGYGFTINPDAFGASGLTTAQFGNSANFVGWNFGTNPGGTACGNGGACWVIVDADGSFNNANGAAGATRPLLLSRYSTTITDVGQLQLMALAPNANYTLAFNLINLAPITTVANGLWGPNAGAGFVPVGNIANPFTGTFNGQGNSIAGLTIAPTNSSVNSIGLFGANLGTIENLTLTGVSITANPNVGLPGQFVGTLTGQNFGLISNVTASGTINGLDIAGVTAGGLVGQNGSLGSDDKQFARITRSHADVSVTLGDGIQCLIDCNGGFNNAGGLVGFNVATIDHSSASGTIVVGANTFAGGLVGTNQNANFDSEAPPTALYGPHIIDSWASGNVSSSAGGIALGGLVGYNAPLAVVWNSRATGNVTSTVASTKDCSPDCPVVNVGGLVGQNFGEIYGGHLPWPEHGCTAGFTCASGLVTVGAGSTGGGLVGENQGIIRNAFATGNVVGAAGPGGSSDFDQVTTLGGLVGGNEGIISHTFATGAVGAGGIVSHDFSTDAISATPVANLDVGGLVGDNGGTIRHSRAFGPVTAGANSVAGGLAGINDVPHSLGCISCAAGDGFNQLALISHSRAFGDVTVGANSIAGGLVAISSGTVRHAGAGGAVVGGDNSVVAGLVGINGLDGLIKFSVAWGSATDAGPDSVVAGLVGVNGGTIIDSRSRVPVSGGSDSYVGGLVGINVGSVQDSNESGTIAATGGGNVTGGFVALNLGTIDPSFASGSIDGGSNSVTGGFAGGNVSIPNAPAGFSLPGIISNDSSYTGPSSYPQVASTSITSAYPTPPAFFSGCTDGLCSLFQSGLFTPGTPSTPAAPPITPPVDTPPPAQLVVVPPNNNNTTQPILVNQTVAGPANGGNGGNGNNGSNHNNGGPPNTGPPPGPGLGRSFDEQHFSGVPPIGETRFLKGEIVVQISNTVPLDQVMKIAQQLGITLISSQSVGLNGRVIYRFSAANGKDIRLLIHALEKNQIIASAQPNYVFNLSQSAPAAPPAPAAHTDAMPPTTESQPGLANADTASLESLPAGDAAQYVIDKMHLAAVHHMASGRNVVVAVIDSEIDLNHPDLKGVVVDRFDATQGPSHPHVHGTGMAGAIAARHRLLGVAPNVRLIAIKAFDEQASSAEATSYQILKGLDYAIEHKARIINMSFAGPRDPMMERTLKIAHDKGIILIAAAGNAGPKSPPLYPGADASVIAVTASDYNDAPFRMANRGRYIAVAAPGVDVMVPAPGNTYQLTTGTSVAAAHVSGVAALLVERKPNITPDEVRAVLMRTATAFSARPKGEEDGAGLVDPVGALRALGPARSVELTPQTNVTVH
jgi:subtilase family protein